MSIFLENCFGCLRLRTGVLIIGYLYLIFSLVSFIMHTIMIISFYIAYKEMPERDAVINLLTLIQMTIFSYVLTVALLVYGATKGNRFYLLPFVAVNALMCAYALCYQLLCCFFLVPVLFSAVASFIFVSITGFVIYVILSHHQELKKFTLENREDDEVSIVNTV